MATRTTNQLIEGAFKLIGLFSEERALENARTTEGLFYLNALIDQLSSSPVKIPYNLELSFNLVLDQRSYVFSRNAPYDVDSDKIVNLKFVTIEENNLTYPVEVITDEYFINRARLDTLKSRPLQCFLQNGIDKSTITFFQLPDKTYTTTIKAKFVLPELILSTDITNMPSDDYLFLEYALGRQMHAHYPGSQWTSDQENYYQQLFGDSRDSHDLDLDTRTGSGLLKPYFANSRRAFYSGS